jgi:parallel beta-helix repeat protein
MRKIRLVGIGIALMLMSLAIGGGSVAADSSVTISRANMAEWAFEGPTEDHTGGIETGEFVPGPDHVPSGSGSAHFKLENQQSADFLATTQFAGKPLGTITTLKFSTYVASDTATTKSVALEFDIDYDPTLINCGSLTTSASCYQSRFVFVPGFNNSPQTVIPNQWQTWDTLDSNNKDWYASIHGGSTGIPGHAGLCAQNTPCSWSDLKGAYPNAAVMQRSGPGQFGVKAGSGFSTFDGNTDAIVTDISGTNTTYDFELGSGAATFHVSPHGDDTLCNGQTNADANASTEPDCSFKTIKHATDTAVAGDTINVHAGTYSEQVNVSKNLTLTGDGAGSTTIQAPSTLTADADGKMNLVEFRGGISDTMSGFTVSGPGPSGCNSISTGIAALGGASLNVSATNVTSIRDSTLSGCQNGEGIRVGTPRDSGTPSVGSLTASHVQVTDFQKNGVVVAGPGSTGTISDTTITGAGATATIAQNGLEIIGGALGTVNHNILSNIECDNASCNPDPLQQYYATGISTTSAATGTVVSNNTVSHTDVGIDSDGTGKTITGNTLTDNRFEGIFLYQGNATVSGNTITGGKIGVEIAAFNGDTVNAQGTLTKNLISGATTAGIQLQIGPANTTTLATITGDSNSIHDNGIGVNNTITTGTPLTMTNNYWGSANGPTNAINKFNVGSQGNSASANVNFIPWLSTISGAPGSFTGTSFAPVTNTAPTGQFASIQAAVTASNTGGTVNAAAGTFTENVTVGQALTINGAKHGVDARTGRTTPNAETILTGGGFSLNTDAITVDGFTVQNPGGTDKDGIVLNPAHSGYQVLNNIIQNNTIGISANANGAAPTQIKQNLIQHNNEVGAASGNGIYADQGSANLLIDNNTFVDNVNGGAAAFFGAPGTQHDITFSNNHLDSDLDLSNITTVTVSNNTSTNGTDGSIIIIDGGDNGVTVTGNTITGGNGSAVAILARNGNSSNQNIDIHGNTLTGNTNDGVLIGAGGITTATLTVHGNTIAGNHRDGVNNGAVILVDATNNWWGTQTGPAHASNVGGTGNAVTDNVIFTPWCGLADCSIHYGIATKLVYTAQPVGGPATAPLATQPVLQAQDTSGNLGINFAGPVALAFGANPGAATLGGTTTVNAVAGVATFTNVSVSKAGTGDTLVASSTDLTSATSNAFTVGAPIPTVSSMDTSTGTVNGGTTVVITGTNFVTGDAVSFGGVAATNVQVLSGTQISVTTPAHAEGLVNVRVVNASNQGNTLAQQYHYITSADVNVPTTRGGPIGPAGNNPAPAPPGRPAPTPNPHP